MKDTARPCRVYSAASVRMMSPRRASRFSLSCQPVFISKARSSSRVARPRDSRCRSRWSFTARSNRAPLRVIKLDTPARKSRIDLAVDPGPAILAHFALTRLRNLQRPPRTEPLRDEVLGGFAKAVHQIVAGDHHIAHARIASANDDMSVRMPCIVMIDGDPVETPAEVTLHLRHEFSGGAFQIAKARAVFG